MWMFSFDTYMSRKDDLRRSINAELDVLWAHIAWEQIERVVDMGCGTGVTAMELATHHDIFITCIDRDERSISVLRKKALANGVEDRIETRIMDMRDISYPPGHFDMILSEGSVQFIGFEAALEEWGALLRGGGYFFIHMDSADLERRLEALSLHDFAVLGIKMISSDTWMRLYVRPLLDIIDSIQDSDSMDAILREQMEQDEHELREAVKDEKKLSSMVYLLKKH